MSINFISMSVHQYLKFISHALTEAFACICVSFLTSFLVTTYVHLLIKGPPAYTSTDTP